MSHLSLNPIGVPVPSSSSDHVIGTFPFIIMKSSSTFCNLQSQYLDFMNDTWHLRCCGHIANISTLCGSLFGFVLTVTRDSPVDTFSFRHRNMLCSPNQVVAHEYGVPRPRSFLQNPLDVINGDFKMNLSQPALFPFPQRFQAPRFLIVVANQTVVGVREPSQK